MDNLMDYFINNSTLDNSFFGLLSYFGLRVSIIEHVIICLVATAAYIGLLFAARNKLGLKTFDKAFVSTTCVTALLFNLLTFLVTCIINMEFAIVKTVANIGVDLFVGAVVYLLLYLLERNILSRDSEDYKTGFYVIQGAALVVLYCLLDLAIIVFANVVAALNA